MCIFASYIEQIKTLNLQGFHQKSIDRIKYFLQTVTFIRVITLKPNDNWCPGAPFH